MAAAVRLIKNMWFCQLNSHNQFVLPKFLVNYFALRTLKDLRKMSRGSPSTTRKSAWFSKISSPANTTVTGDDDLQLIPEKFAKSLNNELRLSPITANNVCLKIKCYFRHVLHTSTSNDSLLRKSCNSGEQHFLSALKF